MMINIIIAITIIIIVNITECVIILALIRYDNEYC